MRSAASRTSRGATRGPKRRCAARRPTETIFASAADLLLRDAKGFGHNAFKIDLARRAIVRALTQAARGTPQSQSARRSVSALQWHPISAPPTSRVDGRAKVTGAAKYAAEFNVAGLATAASSAPTIPKGRIGRIDAGEAWPSRACSMF